MYSLDEYSSEKHVTTIHWIFNRAESSLIGDASVLAFRRNSKDCTRYVRDIAHDVEVRAV